MPQCQQKNSQNEFPFTSIRSTSLNRRLPNLQNFLIQVHSPGWAHPRPHPRPQPLPLETKNYFKFVWSDPVMTSIIIFHALELGPAAHGRGRRREWLNSEFLIESSTNIRNIRNLHRQFEIQMLVENHKCPCFFFHKWSRVDLRPEMSVLLGVWKHCYGPEISIWPYLG